MKTNNVHVIREAVIMLLRRNGHSVIEAVDQWDRVYSVQYEKASPNVTHCWIIGEYTFEFTKVGEPKVSPVQAETPAVSHRLRNMLVMMAVLGVIGIALVMFAIH
jgi:hypothetical protein